VALLQKKNRPDPLHKFSLGGGALFQLANINSDAEIQTHKRQMSHSK
jgi:superfamily II RNA helicase